MHQSDVDRIRAMRSEFCVAVFLLCVIISVADITPNIAFNVCLDRETRFFVLRLTTT